LGRAVLPMRSPQIPGLQVGTCYRQAGGASTVGGDWFDVLILPSGQIYLAVGDVVGHGIAAAEDRTVLRKAGRALAIEGHRTSQVNLRSARSSAGAATSMMTSAR
jgi:serine phosphatase RsbU (regulator of sigma subunit)